MIQRFKRWLYYKKLMFAYKFKYNVKIKVNKKLMYDVLFKNHILACNIKDATKAYVKKRYAKYYIIRNDRLNKHSNKIMDIKKKKVNKLIDKHHEYAKILNFINEIKIYDKSNTISKTFNKFSYQFATMLKFNFPFVDVYWDVFGNIFCIEVNSRYFTIDGEYYPKNKEMLKKVSV